MILEFRNVSFHYTEDVQALTNVSLTLLPGEAVALVGHNGSGKTTLVKHLNGLLRPTAGDVLIDGESTSEQRVPALARKVALLFQNPDNQICKGTVWEEVAFGPRNLDYSQTEIEALTDSALDAFGLSGMRNTNPHDLGFSERKRLAIASVIAMNTQVVVLDEPTAGLDPYETAMLEEVLRTLRASGKTVLTISHDMDFVAENMTRVITLGEGRIQYDGNVAGLFSERNLAGRCGLISPQVFQVAERLGLQPVELTPAGVVDALADARK